MPIVTVPIEAVLFDYGLTLVSFSFPRDCLLAALERHRPRLGAATPPAETIMREVLEPLEAELEGYGEDEVDYMEFYERAWRRAGIQAVLCTALARQPAPEGVPTIGTLAELETLL